MLTAEERALLPKIIELYEQRMRKQYTEPMGEQELINAQLAIHEARRMLKAAQEINAQAADRMRER